MTKPEATKGLAFATHRSSATKPTTSFYSGLRSGGKDTSALLCDRNAFRHKRSLAHSHTYVKSAAAVVVDGPNCYHAARELGGVLQYGRLLALLAQSFRIVDLWVALVLHTEARVDGLLRRLRALHANLVIRELRFTPDGSPRSSDNDADIALAAARATRRAGVETVCLVSGDAMLGAAVGDFAHECGKQFSVASFPHVAGRSLVRAADCFIRLDRRVLRPSSAV